MLENKWEHWCDCGGIMKVHHLPSDEFRSTITGEGIFSIKVSPMYEFSTNERMSRDNTYIQYMVIYICMHVFIVKSNVLKGLRWRCHYHFSLSISSVFIFSLWHTVVLTHQPRVFYTFARANYINVCHTVYNMYV